MQIVSTEASPTPVLSFVYMLAGIVGMAAAAALIVWQPEALLTRWHPASLAAVHLFALGGLMPVMLGALFQFLPVACGLSVPRWNGLDYGILLTLMLGAVNLAAGFLNGQTGWLMCAGILLLGSLGLAGSRLAYTLWQQAASGELVASLRRNVVALGVTLSLAATLLGILIWGWNLPLVPLVDWHALWGMGAWVSGLIISVAGVIVPMFHVTDAYPRPWRWAGSLILMLVMLCGLEIWPQFTVVATGAKLLLADLLACFAWLTALRVKRAKRGERDAFYWGWLWVAGLCLLTAGVAHAAILLPDPRWSVALGILLLAGLGGVTVNVMLYRIVPFLSWLHWQRHNPARARLPLLHQIIPERRQKLQLWLDALAVVCLCSGAFFPTWGRAGAALLCVSKLFLASLIAQAARNYRQRLAILKALPPRQRAPRLHE